MTHRSARKSLVRPFIQSRTSEETSPDSAVPVLFGKTVYGLDLALRRYYGIEEFTTDRDCLLRISIAESHTELRFTDGTEIKRGEPIGELHLWNEHVPATPADGQDLAWAITFKRRLRTSLRALASYVDQPGKDYLKAFRAETSFGGRNGLICLRKMTDRWGFELVEAETGHGLWQRFIHFWENCYEAALIRAFNPTHPACRILNFRRDEFWMTRSTLLSRYGPTR